MSGIDLAVLAVIVLSAFISFMRGFFREAVSLAMWVMAILITLTFTAQFSTLLPDTIETAAARPSISSMILFLGTLAIGTIISWLFQRIVDSASLTKIDRFAGVAFGMGRGCILIILLVLAAHLTPAMKQEVWWRESATMPYFEKAARYLHAQLPATIATHFDFSSG